MSQSGSKKLLFAFDFDHTVIDENSDIYVKRLAENGELPESIEAMYSSTGWTEYMGVIFEYLHSKGITQDDIKRCMEEIPITEGIKELLQYCKEKDHESIIISDSNSVFIDTILKKSNLDTTVNEVFTNPAHFDDNGCLRIEYYHTQDWCDLSTVNMCKGFILQDYISKRKKVGVVFDGVYYIGDGTNDFCPSLTLKEDDYVCPRVDFRLLKKINKHLEEVKDNADDNQQKLIAKIMPWETGLDILNHLKQMG